MTEWHRLKAAQVHAAGAKERLYRLFDGGGLYLEVTPQATAHTGRYWRFKYRINGRERRMALGRYPFMTLAQARAAHRSAYQKVLQGIDPAVEKRRCQQAAVNTFATVAAQYLKTNPKGLKQRTLHIAQNRLQMYVMPYIGKMQIDQIDTPTMLTVLRKLERQNKLETLRRVRSLCSRIFRYAISSGLIKRDPVADLAGALRTPTVKNMPAITKLEPMGKLMRQIAAYPGLLSRYALQITAYTLLRNMELRQGQWTEIDFHARVWRVPGSRMKTGGTDHIVPLSRQCFVKLQELQAITGNGQWIFSEGSKPMSENTPNKALHDMGYKGIHCLHGFRSSFSSIMNERDANPDVIEACLAHANSNRVRAAYNRAEYITARATLLQQWADLLTELEGQQT